VVVNIDTDIGPLLLLLSGVTVLGPDIGIPDIGLNVDTDIRYHPILYPILTPISVVAGPDIGHPDIGPDTDTDIGYALYDIGDRMTRYRGVPYIGVNIGVNVTRYRVSFDMTRYRVT
jgi:hypothetical protein